MKSSSGTMPLRAGLVLAAVLAIVVVVASVLFYQKRRTEVARQAAEQAEQLLRTEREAETRAQEAAERQRQIQQQQARIAEERREEVERQALALAEPQRLEQQAEHELGEQRQRAADETRRERQRAEQRRLSEQQRPAEQERVAEQQRPAAELQAERESEERAKREEEQRQAAEEEATVQAARTAVPEEEPDDDTPDVETDSTIDGVKEQRGLKVNGDLRPIYDQFELDDRDGGTDSDRVLGIRFRVGTEWGFAKQARVGARLAGLCFTGDCDFDFVMESASPGPNGLLRGQVTLDQLYVHGFSKGQFDLAIGRLQTRFVLRGGVYAKSLDRNDSNNVNVTWTDGFQGTYRGLKNWSSHFILQRNARDGTGSIRRGLLDFDDSGARNTYFVGFENIHSWGPIVQRGIDVSYLPNSLLKDGDPDGRREDYWGLVGRLAFRWPQRSKGPRLRAGLEVGYAPETPTADAVGLDESGDFDGLAWDVVVSVMDFAPGHSIGLNYARTGPAWYLSPQFRPNEELIEVRYQWRPEHFPLLEARIRKREDIDQGVGTLRKDEALDLYVRLTWEFTIKDY